MLFEGYAALFSKIDRTEILEAEDELYIYYHIDDLKGDSVPVAFDVLEPIEPESEPIPVGTPVIVR